MGFFDTTSSSTSNMTYSNPTLQAYTSAYMTAAPYTFATLDPTATLAAMGQGKFPGMASNSDFKASLQNASDAEKQQAQASQDALQRIQDRQQSGNFLTPQETDFINQSLDQAFASSRNTAMQDWTTATQQLAGSRGLRMSDTPVAQPAMNSLRDMELGFSSQRAQQGLTATMNMSAQQNQFDQGLMDSLNSLQLNRWNARQSYLFGGGMSGAQNIGYSTQTTGTQTQGMSGFGQVMAGFQMTNAALDLGQKAGNMYSGFNAPTTPPAS